MPYTKNHPFYGDIQLFSNDRYVCDHIYNNCVWEQYMVDKFTAYYTTGNVIDIGAHIGLHSIALSKLVKPTGLVYSFEAHPSIYKLLEHNCFNHSNIITHNKAVSGTSNAVLYVEDVDFDSADVDNTGGFGTQSIHETERLIRVDTTSIDDHQIQDVALVKIDVEGNEMNVLEGMKRTLMKQKPILFIEIHPDDRTRKLEDIERLYGYVVVETLTEIDFIMKTRSS